MKNGVKIGIGVGITALLGVGGYFAYKKISKKDEATAKNLDFSQGEVVVAQNPAAAIKLPSGYYDLSSNAELAAKGVVKGAEIHAGAALTSMRLRDNILSNQNLTDQQKIGLTQVHQNTIDKIAESAKRMTIREGETQDEYWCRTIGFPPDGKARGVKCQHGKPVYT